MKRRCTLWTKKCNRTCRSIAFAALLSLSGCSKDDDRQTVPATPSKPGAQFTLLLQDTVLEGALAPTIRSGIDQALTQIAAQEGGFANHTISIVEHRIGTQTQVDAVKAVFDKSAAVFAVLDEQASYVVAQAAASSPVPLFFLNDGPLRTCNPNALETVLPTAWQVGMTDSQSIEPFLISLASALKNPEENFRFSFFSTDSLWPRRLSEYVSANVAALGFQTAHAELTDPRVSDFYGPLRQVLRHRSNVLFLTVVPGMANRLFEQTAKMLIYRDYALATLWLLPEERLSSVGEGADRVWTMSRYTLRYEPQTPAALDIDQTVWNHSGTAQLATAHATGAYIAVQLLQKAALKVGGIEPVSLNAGLMLSSLQSPHGLLWFNRENHVLTQPLFRVQIEGGNYIEPHYLGDVEHPGLTRCSHQVFRQLEEEEKQPYQSIYE